MACGGSTQECSVFRADRVCSKVDEDAFCDTMVEMLDAVQVFWDGLEASRRTLENDRPPAPEQLLHQGATDF